MEHHAEGLLLEADTYTALVKTIQRDCRVSLFSLKNLSMTEGAPRFLSQKKLIFKLPKALLFGNFDMHLCT